MGDKPVEIRFRTSDLEKALRLSIVVPAYNESQTIERVINRLLEVPLEKEIIVVDDGSTDDTAGILERLSHPDVKLLRHEGNRGKGAALRTAFAEASGDVIIIQDADLEYDPSDYDNLIEPIRAGHADVVYGSRFLGGPHRVLLFWHYVGNKLITLLSNMMTNLNLTDMETGYKVFRAEVVKGLNLKSNRFGCEPEITAKVAKRGYRVYEVPISYYGRTAAEGKKITWKDGLSALLHVFRFRLFD